MNSQIKLIGRLLACKNNSKKAEQWTNIFKVVKHHFRIKNMQ